MIVLIKNEAVVFKINNASFFIYNVFWNVISINVREEKNINSYKMYVIDFKVYVIDFKV